MDLRTLVIVAGTALGLVVPAATGAPGKAPKVTPSHVKAGKQGSRLAPSAAQPVHRAPFPSWPITTPGYIYIPAAASNFPVVVEDCENYGNNCSDQQLCDIWGLNCPAPTPAATAVTGAQTPQ